MKHIVINLEKFIKLLNGEKVYFNRKPLQFGVNVFTSHLVDLGLKKNIVNEEANYIAKLEDSISLDDILIPMITNKLNSHWCVGQLFISRHEHKDIILEVFGEYLVEKGAITEDQLPLEFPFTV